MKRSLHRNIFELDALARHRTKTVRSHIVSKLVVKIASGVFLWASLDSRSHATPRRTCVCAHRHGQRPECTERGPRRREFCTVSHYLHNPLTLHFTDDPETQTPSKHSIHTYCIS